MKIDIRKDDLKTRMHESRLQLASRLGRQPSLEETAQWVAAAAGLDKIPDISTVSYWFQGKPPRTLEMMDALARVLGVDPGWLAFGSASQAPPPGWRVTKLHETKWTMEKVDRFLDALAIFSKSSPFDLARDAGFEDVLQFTEWLADLVAPSGKGKEEGYARLASVLKVNPATVKRGWDGITLLMGAQDVASHLRMWHDKECAESSKSRQGQGSTKGLENLIATDQLPPGWQHAPKEAFIPINTPEEREKAKAYIAALQQQILDEERKKAEGE